MPAPHPRMHGLTHVPGGSDPIPTVAAGGIQYDVSNVGDWLRVETTDTASGGPTGTGIYLEADVGAVVVESVAGEVNLQSGTDIKTFSGRDVIWSADRDVYVNSDRDSGIVANGDILLHAGAVAGLLKLVALPTTDPGVSNAVWNDSGTLKISP